MTREERQAKRRARRVKRRRLIRAWFRDHWEDLARAVVELAAGRADAAVKRGEELLLDALDAGDDEDGTP